MFQRAKLQNIIHLLWIKHFYPPLILIQFNYLFVKRRISRAEFLVVTVLCVCWSIIETCKCFPVLFLQGGKHRSVASYESDAEQQLPTFGLAHAIHETDY